MELEETKETASKQDVEDICRWLKETEGAAGVERVAQSIRNCYSGAEREFGPGKDKTVVAQAMQNLATKRKKAVAILLYSFTVCVVTVFVAWLLWDAIQANPGIEQNGAEYNFAFGAGTVVGGMSGVAVAIAFVGAIQFFRNNRFDRSEVLLVKYFTRCAKLEERLAHINNKNNRTEGEGNGQ